MAWGYLARAYAIKEFAYMRANDADNGDEIDESMESVTNYIEFILGMAESNLSFSDVDPYDRRTATQCRKWLKDFRDGRKA